jgi:hypothetical protein
MTTARHTHGRLRHVVVGLARLLGRLAGFVLAVRLLAVLAGPLISAGAALLMVTGLRGWARIEARLFPAPQPCTELVHQAASAADQQHLAFAQALATVAARYLAECEAEDQP